MSISIDGTTLIWTGTVTITNATDLSTGVATLMLTPEGGIGTLPVFAQGESGLPPVFDAVNVTQIPYGQTPNPPVLATVSSGGPGVASHYTLGFEVNTGQQGPAGTMTISGATDIEGTLTDKYTLRYVAADNKWMIVPPLCGDTFAATVFSSYSGNSTAVVLATVTVPAQPFDWRPTVTGTGIPSGTANTHVDLACRMNSSTSSGDVVGYGLGITGAGSGTIPKFPITLQKNFGAAIGAGSYGRIPAGQAGVFYFMALQTNGGTADAWSIPSSTMDFTVKVDPIP